MAGPEPTSCGGLIRKVIWMVGVSELLPLLAQKLKISVYRTRGGLASSSPFWRWAWLLPLRWVSYTLWPLSRSSVQKVHLRGISSGYLGGGMSRPHCLFHPIPGLLRGRFWKQGFSSLSTSTTAGIMLLLAFVFKTWRETAQSWTKTSVLNRLIKKSLSNRSKIRGHSLVF